ncbi:MAG: PP2C family protein-serine/threonine phosphatase [Nitrospinales bacterium]
MAEKNLKEAHKRANAALLVRNQALTQLDKELSEAAEYVRSMLPDPQKNDKICTEWQHFPSSSLGGDAFGYHWIDVENFAIYLLDVSGHGVGAALLSASVLNVLRSESLPNVDFKDPKQVLEALNVAFPSDENNDMFFTFWYSVYNTSDRSIIYASAGHPPALLFENEQKATKLKTANFIIGGIPDVSYQQEKHFIGKGASLFIFSDGVYEIEKHNGSMLSFNEYTSLLSDYMSDGSKSLQDLYNKTLKISKEQVFEDDYTILKANFL